ncbi:MAG: hypothetical protein PHF00_08230, partial [Elusimicrobia bacterium]|nr:hypothetical protein [Elusimicrobiota bacterium]
VQPEARKGVEAYIDRWIDTFRRRRYDKDYEAHAKDPIGEKERAYAASQIFGLGNQPKLEMEQGRQEYEKGNYLGFVGHYGKAGYFIGAETWSTSAGAGLLATGPLKAAYIGKLPVSAQADALKALNNAEQLLFLGPMVPGAVLNTQRLIQALGEHDSEAFWRNFDELYAIAASFSGVGLGLFQARLKAEVAKLKAAGKTPPRVLPEPGTGPAQAKAAVKPGAAPPTDPATGLPKFDADHAGKVLGQAKQPEVAIIDPDAFLRASGETRGTTNGANQLAAGLAQKLKPMADKHGVSLGKIAGDRFYVMGEAPQVSGMITEAKAALGKLGVEFGKASAKGVSPMEAFKTASEKLAGPTRYEAPATPKGDGHGVLPSETGREDLVSEIYNGGIMSPTGWLKRVFKKFGPGEPPELRAAMERAIRRGEAAEEKARPLIELKGKAGERQLLEEFRAKLNPLEDSYREIAGILEKMGSAPGQQRAWSPGDLATILNEALTKTNKLSGQLWSAPAPGGTPPPATGGAGPFPPSETKAETQAPKPTFITVEQAKQRIREVADRVLGRLAKVEETLKQKGLAPLSESGRQEVFLKQLYRELNPEKGAPGRRLGRGDTLLADSNADLKLPQKLAEGVTADHHQGFFKPETPERNSTMQVLDRVEAVLDGPGTREQKLERLKRSFSNISTDNLGDGAWSMWILNNIERVAADPVLRQRIRLATHFEDFGVFGRQAYASARNAPNLAKALNLQQAVFKAYDDALKKYGLSGSDRFGSLPPERQRALMDEVLRNMTRALDDPNARAELAGAFGQEVTAVEQQVRAARTGLSPEAKQQLAKEGGDPKALDDIFIYDSDKVKAEGVFSGWGGVPLAHNKNMQLSFQRLADGRTQFILAVPNGEKAPSLAPLGEALAKANAEKAARLGLSEHDVKEGKAGQVVGRGDTLQFAFAPGILLSPEEIMLALARQRGVSSNKTMVVEPGSKVQP